VKTSLDETIAAIATPRGEGAIAVVRVSGPGALPIVEKAFPGNTSMKNAPGRTVHHGYIYDSSRSPVDEVLVTVFRRPASYTGEDLAEVSCHGGILVTDLVLKSVLDHGARLAEPGEFTRRAFLNGKLDLSQAEAVADLISAKSLRAEQLSLAHLRGQLGRRVNEIRDLLIKACGLVEIDLDFSEEGISVVSREGTISVLESSLSLVDELLKTYRTGKVLRDGVRVAIVGPPNAGKSSLFNALLGNARAIVSEIPGTTRDYIEESISISGVLFTLVDTAGLRESTDEIESQGIGLSQQILRECDIAILVIDQSKGDSQLPGGSWSVLQPSKVIMALNKADIAPEESTMRTTDGESANFTRVSVSAKTLFGLPSLRKAMFELVLGSQEFSDENPQIVSVRHQSALKRALDSLTLAISSARGGKTGEFVALDVRGALNALGEITGKVTSEDILNNIFSRFCIGK
jgi:tRNA modification GTPase